MCSGLLTSSGLWGWVLPNGQPRPRASAHGAHGEGLAAGPPSGAWSSSSPGRPPPNWPHGPSVAHSLLGTRALLSEGAQGCPRLWVGSRTLGDRVEVITVQAVLAGLWVPGLRTHFTGALALVPVFLSSVSDTWLYRTGPSSRCDCPTTGISQTGHPMAHCTPPPPVPSLPQVGSSPSALFSHASPRFPSEMCPISCLQALQTSRKLWWKDNLLLKKQVSTASLARVT